MELLEELLLDYQGTLLLVSHDREFLDNAVTSCLVLEGDGKITESVGGYSDWERHRQLTAEERSKPKKGQTQPQARKKTTGKLSYKDQRELDALPQRIESLELELAELQDRLNDPSLYREQSDQLGDLQQQFDRVQNDLENAYESWEKLETLKASL
jgi:ATP-binding cassette subfamily F protein uup